MTKYGLFGSVGRRKSLLSKNSMVALLRFGKMPLNKPSKPLEQWSFQRTKSKWRFFAMFAHEAQCQSW